MKEKYLNIPYHFSASLHGLFPPNTLVMRAKSVAQMEKKKERRKSCNPNLFFLPIFEHICKFISIFVFIFSMDILMASFFPLSLYQHLYSSREKNWLSCKVLCFLFFFLIKLICFQLIKSLVCFLCVCVQPQECCIAEELHTKHWLVQD